MIIPNLNHLLINELPDKDQLPVIKAVGGVKVHAAIIIKVVSLLLVSYFLVMTSLKIIQKLYNLTPYYLRHIGLITR
jgi:hypothetical protein